MTTFTNPGGLVITHTNDFLETVLLQLNANNIYYTTGENNILALYQESFVLVHGTLDLAADQLEVQVLGDVLDHPFQFLVVGRPADCPGARDVPQHLRSEDLEGLRQADVAKAPPSPTFRSRRSPGASPRLRRPGGHGQAVDAAHAVESRTSQMVMMFTTARVDLFLERVCTVGLLPLCCLLPSLSLPT